MRTMEHPSLTEQANTHTRALAFTKLRTKLKEQRFDVSPVDVATGWSGKYQFQRSLVSAFHVNIVP
jgi:homogentisate 1,2-dioxygenase